MKSILRAILILIASTCGQANAGKNDKHANNGKQPNIVLFFVDDLGWYDLGYRNPKFETPNIDQLASESLDFQRRTSPARLAAPVVQHC